MGGNCRCGRWASENEDGRRPGERTTLGALKATSLRPNHGGCPLSKAGWWERLFAVVLFAFYVNFIPIHLATETHLDDSLVSVAEADLHHHAHDDSDHDEDSDHHHGPHRASDHTLALTSSAKAPNLSALAVFLPPAITSVSACEPEPQPTIPIFERVRPPGESPPGPRQPRAPPLA